MHLRTTTQTQYSAVDLINAAVEWLVRRKIELPSFKTLRLICGRINDASNRKQHQEIVSRLTPKLRSELDGLLTVKKGEVVASWSKIREHPAAPSVSSIKDYLKFVDWAWAFGDLSPLLEDVPKPRIRHLNAEAREQAPSDLKNFPNTDHRDAIMVAALVTAQQSSRDVLAEFFCRRMAQFEKQAQEDLTAVQRNQRSLVERIVSTFREVLVALKERKPVKLFRLIWEIIKLAGSREGLIGECDEILGTQQTQHLPYIYDHYRSNRSVLLESLSRLPLRTTTGESDVLLAVNHVLGNATTNTEHIPAAVNLEWASERWQKLIAVKKQGVLVFHRESFEICTLLQLATDLKSGDVAIVGAAAHADYRSNLLGTDAVRKQLDEYADATGIPTESGSAFVIHLKDQLQSAIALARQRLKSKPLGTRSDGNWSVPKFKSKAPSAHFADLERVVTAAMKPRTLMEILVNADDASGFLRRFGPPSGVTPTMGDVKRRHFLTVFTFATGMSAAELCRSLREPLDPEVIGYINRQHFTSDQLAKANADVINKINRLPVSALYGDGLRGGTDGTYVAIRRDNLYAEYHFRYRQLGGIKHQLISEKYVALFSTFIPCSAWEATYLLDMLMANQSDIAPRVVHGDTQSQTAPILGLAYLLGIEVRPRIRGLHDVVLYKPDADQAIDFLQDSWRGVIDWDLIASQYDDVLRVVISIQQGAIIPSNLIKHLGTYSKRNRLYQALREIGRVIRTIVVIEYITNEDERRAVSKMQNVVEAYNAYCDWFVIGNHGVITDNDPDEFDKRVKYRDLLANCAILQTMVDLTEVARNLHGRGYTITPDDMQRITPYLTKHIERYGQYTLELTPTVVFANANHGLPTALTQPMKPSAEQILRRPKIKQELSPSTIDRAS